LTDDRTITANATVKQCSSHVWLEERTSPETVSEI